MNTNPTNPTEPSRAERTTVELSRTNPTLVRTTRPINTGSHTNGTFRPVPRGTFLVAEVVVTQTTRADGQVCDPSYSLILDGEHQCGGFARHLGEDGWPDVLSMIERLNGPTPITVHVVACPGCCAPVMVAAPPNGETWTDMPQWCPSCGGTGVNPNDLQPSDVPRGTPTRVDDVNVLLNWIAEGEREPSEAFDDDPEAVEAWARLNGED